MSSYWFQPGSIDIIESNVVIRPIQHRYEALLLVDDTTDIDAGVRRFLAPDDALLLSTTIFPALASDIYIKSCTMIKHLHKTRRVPRISQIAPYSTMRQRTRLAILECDTPLPETKKQYAGYGGVFKSLLNKGAKAEGYGDVAEVLDISTHQIELDSDNYPDIDSVDALLLTGSSMWKKRTSDQNTNGIRTRQLCRFSMDQQASNIYSNGSCHETDPDNRSLFWPSDPCSGYGSYCWQKSRGLGSRCA